MSKRDTDSPPEKKKNILDEDIEKTKEEKIKIEDNITSQTKSTEDTTTRFSEYVKTEGTKLENALGNIGTSVKDFKKGSTDFVENSKTSLKENMQKITIISELVIKRLYLTLAFFAGIFFISYFYLNGIKIDAGVASGLVTIIAIFIMIYKSSTSFNKKILESTSKGNTELNELQKTAPLLDDDSLKVNSPFNKADKELVSIDSSLRRILGSVRDFIPVAEKLYSSLGRRSRQNTFAKTLQNALLSYRIPLSADASDYLLNVFGSLDDLEIKWIDEVSRNLKPFIQIEPKIIKLCYFDYIGDSANLKNSWSDVLAEPALLGQLTQILLTYVIEKKPRDDYEGLIKLVSTLDPFSLSSFEKAYYSFYYNLDRKKRHLINSMIDIHVKMEDIEPKILEFPPKDPDEEKWEQELIDYSSRLLNLDSNIIALFYYDRIGNYGKRKDVWSYIKKGNELFIKFVQLLIDNKLLEIPDNYRNNKQLGKKISQILDNQSEFDFFNIRQSAYAEFKMIDSQKKSLTHALDDHGIHFGSSKTETDFNSFIPMTADYLNEISAELSSKLNLDKDFILLFYGSNYDKYLMENVFKEIKKMKTTELAGVLVDKNLIKIEKGLQKSEEIKNISLILGFLPEFNLVQIQNFYQNYVNLLEVAKKLVTFMGSEELAKRTDIDFKKIVDILPEPDMQDRLDSINKILRILLDEEKLFGNENMDAITIAILCVFLVNQEDVSSRRCCQRAQQIEISSKILYHNMMMKEEETLRTKERFSLLKVIRNVILDSSIRYQFLANFKDGLAIGRLYQSSKDMASKQIQDAKEQMEQVSSLKGQIEKIQTSFREFLNTELPYDFMEYAINSQIVQAYMISSRSQKGIFTQIVGDRMQKICLEMSQTDSSFKDLLIMGEPKEDQFIGKSTRIGVVPLGMDFEEFSKKFHMLFDKTVEDYIEEKKTDQKSDFSVNIFRILASPTTFKRIKLDGTTQSPDQDDPIQIIRDLIVERFSVEDGLSLVATSKEGSVRKLIEVVVDEKGKLYSLLENDLKINLNKKEILDLIRNKDFDKTLYEKFDCTKFTDLAKKTYQIEMTNDTDHVKSLIQNNTLQVFQKFKVEITDDESKIFSNLIYRVLNIFGTALTTTS